MTIIDAIRADLYTYVREAEEKYATVENRMNNNTLQLSYIIITDDYELKPPWNEMRTIKKSFCDRQK